VLAQMRYYSTVTRAVSSTVVRRERMLPTRGKILVDIDDRVDAVDIIGRYETPGKLLILDARAALNLKRRDLSTYLLKRPGEIVRAGDVLASQPRLGKMFPRALRAPTGGRIVAVSDSQVVLESETAEAEVRAQISGRVVSVMPERGAVIETTATLIQCIWGTGTMSHGVLRAAVNSPDEILTPDKVDVSCLGAIVIGGAGTTCEALIQASKMQARGLILGALSSALIDQAAALPFPVLVTEGLGEFPMGQTIFGLLKDHVGSEATADPGDMNPWRPRFPEIIIPSSAPAAGESPLDNSLKSGDTVRVVRGERGGFTGTVTRLPEHPVAYDIGLTLPSIEIQSDSGERMIVPTSNVEILR